MARSKMDGKVEASIEGNKYRNPLVADLGEEK